MDERHDSRRVGTDRRHRKGEHLVWVSVSGVVAIVMILGVAVYGITRLNDIVGTVKEVQEEQAFLRADQVRTACLQANESTRRVRLTFANSVEVVRPPNPTPEINERVDQFINIYTQAVNNTLRYRDCTPEGIKAYFANPPAPPPPENCDPDGKGFCK